MKHIWKLFTLFILFSCESSELPAGGPYVLEVNQRKINDVYIGDVWVAGGQSNMEWRLKSQVIGAEKEFSEGGNPQIPNHLSS